MDLTHRLRPPESLDEREMDGTDGGELDVDDAFGEHDIEYWVRRGDRLVPATEDDLARIRAWESEHVARELVERWERGAHRPWHLRLALRARRLIVAWRLRTADATSLPTAPLPEPEAAAPAPAAGDAER